MKTQIYFETATQFLNAGDQLINCALLNQLRPYGEIIVSDIDTPAWYLDVICQPNDTRFSNIIHGRFYSGLFKHLLHQRLNREKVRSFIALPPGHFSRQGQKQAINILKWYLKLLILRSLGCKVIRAGFSIGPFDGINAWVESLGTWACAFYGVRDYTSQALGKKYGFRHLHYLPDMAWSFTPKTPVATYQYQGHVVISFRSNAYGVDHSSEYLQPIMEKLHNLIAASELATRKIIVAYQVESDRLASLDLFSRLKSDFDVELIDSRLSVEEASSLYASSYCVISNRLHVLLLASQNGTLAIPFVNEADNVKITSIFRDNQLDRFLIDSDKSKQESLAKLNEQMASRKIVIEQFSNVSIANSKLIEDAFFNIFRL